ncbi:MAG: hypothetical protein QOE70_1012 [Chthoniobacter sp.]|jgi:hypothetical protein|nr:hypothetical protein [Chthoniobacter sp.]
MADAAPRARGTGGPLRAHEAAFVLLGAGALGALLWTGGWRSRMGAEIALGTLAYSGALAWLWRRDDLRAERFRMAVNYLFALWFYGATSRVTLALGAPPRDGVLLGIDEFFFGRTPAVSWERFARPWLTETLSACYLSYQIYLHGVLLWAFGQSREVIQRLSALLFAGFAVGFLGYLLVPALGPGPAFPELFSQGLNGGLLTHANDAVVAHGSAIHGNFPSLHLLITLLLLNHDWHACRRRFWLLLAPVAGLFVSTLYLRYHYAVDLLAGAALFPCVLAACSRWNR